MVKISVEAVFVLVPRRSSAAIVRVITCELPGAPVCVQYALVVCAAFDPSQKSRPYNEASKVDHGGGVAAWHRDYDVGSMWQFKTLSRSWNFPIEHNGTFTLSNELRELPPYMQALKLNLNSL